MVARAGDRARRGSCRRRRPGCRGGSARDRWRRSARGPPPTIRQSRIGSSMRSPMDCDSGGSAMTVPRLRPDALSRTCSRDRSAPASPGSALQEGIWSLEATNIRDFATDKHRSVDDTPAGGGAGMVLRPDVLAAALDSVADGRPMLALTPRGAPLTQARVRELAAGEGVILLCGRFEGFDERIFEARPLEPVSVGDYVLSGGELGAMVDPRCLREAASRGNGRGLQRRGGELRAGSPGISALYPACDMGRAHDPRSAAVGGSCEDRGVATRTRGRRYTAKAAGPDRAPRGRIAGTALWRAATRYEG